MGFAYDKGYEIHIPGEFWDFYVLDSDGKRAIGVRSVNRRIEQAFWQRFTRERLPHMLILVEGRRPDVAGIRATSQFLASQGVGVLVKGYGWVAKPYETVQMTDPDLVLARAKRWYRREDGVWVKRCSKCGAERTQDEFYGHPKSGRSDPYRDKCKDCMRKEQDVRNKARDGRE